MYRFPLCEPLLMSVFVVLIVIGVDVVMVLSGVVEGIIVVFVGAIVDSLFLVVVMVVIGIVEVVVEEVIIEGLIVVVQNR